MPNVVDKLKDRIFNQGIYLGCDGRFCTHARFDNDCFIPLECFSEGKERELAAKIQHYLKSTKPRDVAEKIFNSFSELAKTFDSLDEGIINHSMKNSIIRRSLEKEIQFFYKKTLGTKPDIKKKEKNCISSKIELFIEFLPYLFKTKLPISTFLSELNYSTEHPLSLIDKKKIESDVIKNHHKFDSLGSSITTVREARQQIELNTGKTFSKILSDIEKDGHLTLNTISKMPEDTINILYNNGVTIYLYNDDIDVLSENNNKKIRYPQYREYIFSELLGDKSMIAPGSYIPKIREIHISLCQSIEKGVNIFPYALLEECWHAIDIVDDSKKLFSEDKSFVKEANKILKCLSHFDVEQISNKLYKNIKIMLDTYKNTLLYVYPKNRFNCELWAKAATIFTLHGKEINEEFSEILPSYDSIFPDNYNKHPACSTSVEPTHNIKNIESIYHRQTNGSNHLNNRKNSFTSEVNVHQSIFRYPPCHR